MSDSLLLIAYQPMLKQSLIPDVSLLIRRHSLHLQDADSLDLMGTKSEGAFYVWTEQEIDEVLGPRQASLFKERYYVKPEGNADLSPRSDPHSEFVGKNCLIARKSVQESAEAAGAFCEAKSVWLYHLVTKALLELQ